jgi:hypothetical protein
MMSKKRLLMLFAFIAFSLRLSAEDQTITIKSHSVNKNVMLLEADLAGRQVELECFVSEKSCAALTPGDYLMVRLTRGGIYQDCANVDIYGIAAHPPKGKQLGEYCLLQP